jgi:hypothetical protein
MLEPNWINEKLWRVTHSHESFNGMEHNTKTLSLVINWMKLKKIYKQFINIQQGVKLKKPSIFVVN